MRKLGVSPGGIRQALLMAVKTLPKISGAGMSYAYLSPIIKQILDAAFERRFQPIKVQEPTVEDTISILRGLKEKYEIHHGVCIKDAALVAAAVLSHRYISDRFLPDKAIDLIDECASKLRIEIDSLPVEIDFTLSDNISTFLAEKGYDEVYGARPLKRAIQKYIENPLSMEMLQGNIKEGMTIRAELDGDTVRFEKPPD